MLGLGPLSSLRDETSGGADCGAADVAVAGPYRRWDLVVDRSESTDGFEPAGKGVVFGGAGAGLVD